MVTEQRVPGRIRQGLNVESGLNDGICVPLLFAAVAIADVESEISEGRSALTLVLEEIGYGVIGGVAGGLLVAAIVIHAGGRQLIAGAWRQVIPAAGAGLAYSTASALGGSGFIGAFVARENAPVMETVPTEVTRVRGRLGASGEGELPSEVHPDRSVAKV